MAGTEFRKLNSRPKDQHPIVEAVGGYETHGSRAEGRVCWEEPSAGLPLLVLPLQHSPAPATGISLGVGADIPPYVFSPSTPQRQTEPLLSFTCHYLTPLYSRFLILGPFGAS